MTQSNASIEAMNLTIVEFMEVEKDHHPYLTGSRSRTVYLFDGYWLPLRKLKYHSSWDWLMPCWDRLRTVISDHFDEDYPAEYCSMCDVWALYCEHVNINGAHRLLHDAIKWFNQQKQNNGN